ncbi:hypothetical protein [Noviherbaspirillum malthae]|uniref:hypothetical protein n=1 Tax=Noviherbaspirillum malthae TaxID=1260987 RepID=UPI00188EBBAC|nr:hypothetical protein [Noviherbaspirillum malthae]
MQRRENRFNPKRKLKDSDDVVLKKAAELALRVQYGGNPEHKKNPGDFGLTPPSYPRSAKSLCDSAGIFSKKLALGYLKQGLEKGLFSERYKGEWPQNIWSVTVDGIPLEAQLENPELGTYHGYPMPASDPFADEILRRWRIKND